MVEDPEHREVEQVEEHRRGAEHRQCRDDPPARRPVERHQHQRPNAQRQQQEQQRRRIFGQRQEAHDGPQRIARHREPRGIAIAVNQPDQHERREHRDPRPDKATVADRRGRAGQEPRTDRKAEHDHPDPGQHRIGRLRQQAERQGYHVALMQHRPQRKQRLVGSEVDGIEQVVPAQDHDPGDQQDTVRQPDQRGQHDHADPDAPDHLQPQRRHRRDAPIEFGQEQHLQRHQHQSALDQIHSGFRQRVPAAVQECRHAGQRDEHRRTQAGGQTGDEQRGQGGTRIHRIGDRDMQEPRLPQMVEQHQHHDQAAQGVDALQPASRRRRVGNPYAIVAI